jgi:hypothetical protein
MTLTQLIREFVFSAFVSVGGSDSATDGPCASSFESVAAAAMCETSGCCTWLIGSGTWHCVPKTTAGCMEGQTQGQCPSGTCWAAGPSCRFQSAEFELGFESTCCYGPED